jgi:hypothetical protein
MYSLTFYDAPASDTEGVSEAQLLALKARWEAEGRQVILVSLRELHPEGEEAYVLVYPNGVNELLGDPQGANKMLEELRNQKMDQKKKIRGRVVSLHSRHRLGFGDTARVADVERDLGTVVAFDLAAGSGVATITKMRSVATEVSGSTAPMIAHVNHYHDAWKCGIDFHGDANRFKVFGVRLGTSHRSPKRDTEGNLVLRTDPGIPLRFQWFRHKQPVGDQARILLPHGSLYVMSATAVGHNYRQSSTMQLRHAAGEDGFSKKMAETRGAGGKVVWY